MEDFALQNNLKTVSIKLIRHLIHAQALVLKHRNQVFLLSTPEEVESDTYVTVHLLHSLGQADVKK